MHLQSDTLSCDMTRLAYWQNQSAYNYNRGLSIRDLGLYDWLKDRLMQLLDNLFGSRFAIEYTETILIIIFILMVLLLVWFVYRKRPELFMRSGKKTLPYTVHEDTIYGVDFQKEIAFALARGDYKEAGRLLYLQTLKSLSDNNIIDWQIYKTPTQYIYEVRPAKQQMSFRNLTNCFLRVRYGNFEVTEQMFNTMKQLQIEIKRGSVS